MTLTLADLPSGPVTLNDATRISLGGTSVQPSGVFQVNCGRVDADAAGNAAAGADEMSGCPGGNAGLGESVGRAGAVCCCGWS